jgi:hypothetical protein
LAGAVSGAVTPSSFGTTTPIGNSAVTIEASTTTAVPLSIRAALGQLANIFNIQNSSGSSLFYANNTGSLFASSTFQTTGLGTFYSGVLAIASSTIGAGTQASGLTINGGATSTGSIAVTSTATSTFTGGIQLSNLYSTSGARIANLVSCDPMVILCAELMQVERVRKLTGHFSTSLEFEHQQHQTKCLLVAPRRHHLPNLKYRGIPTSTGILGLEQPLRMHLFRS